MERENNDENSYQGQLIGATCSVASSPSRIIGAYPSITRIQPIAYQTIISILTRDHETHWQKLRLWCHKLKNKKKWLVLGRQT